jgi:hypothetical protein
MAGKSAKKATVSSEVVDEGEVPLSKAAPATEKGLTNGLGLEHLFPAASKTPAPAKAAAPADEADEDSPEQDAPEKKETPPKDPKTGRFLPRKKEESEPPIEDAHPDDDVETLKKRLKDTRDWATRVNKQNQDNAEKLKKLEADHKALADKLHGTAPDVKPKDMDPVELARLAERTKISKAIAEQAYGPEVVQEMIYAENSPYRQLEQADPYVKARVFEHEQPVMEAIRQLKLKNFHDTYGEDPDSIVAKITEEVRAEFVKNLKKEGRGKRTIEDIGGLHDTGGRGSETHVVSDSKKSDTVNLAEVFKGFPTGSF